ncbi:MAG TPA: rRNA maturation RNase YbeY [Ilumatobacteraceae bacterium]|nr:rRNA maturation RNase YbeY [Ilumatobacteraceae bacterium]
MGDDSRPRLSTRKLVGGDGAPEVHCFDEQNAVPIDLARWQRLAHAVLLDKGVRGQAELTLIFLGESDMAELNEEHMGKTGATDVLAFPLDTVETAAMFVEYAPSRGPDRPPLDLSDVPLLLGDVVICPAVAERNAPEHAGTLDDELALLVVHGVLHVLGDDHATDTERQAMRASELRLLSAHHWNGPPPAAFRQEQPE